MQEALAKCKPARLRGARRYAAGRAGNRAETDEWQGSASFALGYAGSVTGAASARRLRKAIGFGASASNTIAGQKRTPDAGASAGDETPLRAVARSPANGPDTGRQVCPCVTKRAACRTPCETGCPRVGESGASSDAGPICLSQEAASCAIRKRAACARTPRFARTARAPCPRFAAIIPLLAGELPIRRDDPRG